MVFFLFFSDSQFCGDDDQDNEKLGTMFWRLWNKFQYKIPDVYGLCYEFVLVSPNHRHITCIKGEKLVLYAVYNVEKNVEIKNFRVCVLKQ